MKRHSQQDIANLLDKFMDGQTSVEEEAQLADYFRNGDVPAEWEDYRIMFSYFDRGMEGELLPEKEPDMHMTSMIGRRWWGIGAAAAITAAVVSTVLLHRPSTTTQQPPTVIAQTDNDTLVAPSVVEVAPQQLAEATLKHSVPQVRQVRPVHPDRPATRNLKAENAKLTRENERLQRELADLIRRAFIIDLEANGFKTVLNEDGNIVLIDMEQEIENELNNQPTTNIPAL